MKISHLKGIFLDKSSIGRLFQEQITHITIINKKMLSSYTLFTQGCVKLFSLCKNLIYFDANRFCNKYIRLIFDSHPQNHYFTSQLRSLFINTVWFDECLYLLDGRFNQLSSFTVNIKSIDILLTTTVNMVSELNLE
jgi:hypothetical protein